ncbi:MAG: redox protein [Sphingobium sp. 32-64-5]|nr:MAG: redox protein [Sphingobium sp. 32-64-5]
MTDRGGGNPPFAVDARGMRCPWPVLRAARAMRDHRAIVIRADDPIAATELQALAAERGWSFAQGKPAEFHLRRDG